MGALSRRAAAAVSAGGVAKSWAEITALAQRPGMLSLGQGAPDMGGSNRVAAAATIAAIEAGRHDQYSPVNGLPELREAISRYEARTFRVPPPCRESEVAVATSATEALLAAFFASADAGNEAVCCEPLFPWHPSQLALAGAVPVPVRMATPAADVVARFEFPLEGIRRAITPRTRLLIHNTPHNPTGAVASTKETAQLAQLCVENDLVCISDEVYHHHLFDEEQRPHTRIADMPGMAERTLTINSAGKLLNSTGWRVGWFSGPADLVAAASHWVRQLLRALPAASRGGRSTG